MADAEADDIPISCLTTSTTLSINSSISTHRQTHRRKIVVVVVDCDCQLACWSNGKRSNEMTGHSFKAGRRHVLERDVYFKRNKENETIGAATRARVSCVFSLSFVSV